MDAPQIPLSELEQNQKQHIEELATLLEERDSEIETLRARLSSLEPQIAEAADVIRGATPPTHVIRSSCPNMSKPGTNVMEQEIRVYPDGHVTGVHRICSYGKAVLNIQAEVENAKTAAAALVEAVLSNVQEYHPSTADRHWISYIIEFPVVPPSNKK